VLGWWGEVPPSTEHGSREVIKIKVSREKERRRLFTERGGRREYHPLFSKRSRRKTTTWED